MLKTRMFVALLLATVSSAHATADLIGDTYVISAFSFGVESSAALTAGYRGTFDGTEEVIGANPLGNEGDERVVFEILNLVQQVGNRLTFDVSLLLAARDSEGEFTDMLAVDVDAVLGEPALGLLFDLGATNDPITGQVDPLSAFVPGLHDYVLEDAASSLFTATDQFDIGFAEAPSFDNGLFFAGTSGVFDASSLQQRGFTGISQTYRFSASVPEPSSFAVFGVLGLGGLVYRRRKARADRVKA